MGRAARLAAAAVLAAMTASRTSATGPSPGAPPRLAPCPASPTCVSSQAADEAHRVDPIPFSGDAALALARMRAVVEAQPRSRVVRSDGLRFAAEFRSSVFRFVDDVEVAADSARSLLEIRSASRVGYSDLGVNRRRVESLRAAFAAANAGTAASAASAATAAAVEPGKKGSPAP